MPVRQLLLEPGAQSVSLPGRAAADMLKKLCVSATHNTDLTSQNALAPRQVRPRPLCAVTAASLLLLEHSARCGQPTPTCCSCSPLLASGPPPRPTATVVVCTASRSITLACCAETASTKCSVASKVSPSTSLQLLFWATQINPQGTATVPGGHNNTTRMQLPISLPEEPKRSAIITLTVVIATHVCSPLCCWHHATYRHVGQALVGCVQRCKGHHAFCGFQLAVRPYVEC